MPHNVQNAYSETSVAVDGVNFKVIFSKDLLEKQSAASLLNILHCHMYYEAFLVIKGGLAIVTENDRYEVHENQMVLISPDLYHTTVLLDPDTVRLSIGVYIDEQSGKHTEFSKRIQKLLSLMPPIGPALGLSSDLDMIYNSGAKLFSETPFRRQSSVVNFVFYLIKYIGSLSYDVSESSETEFLKPNTKDYRETEIVRYLFDHFTEPISLKEMSRTLYISEQHINRMLKRKYNETFLQRLTRMRMVRAAQLLKSTQLSIADIAYSIGYSSTHNFYTHFRRFYGCTPAAYKKEHGNNQYTEP